MSKKDMRTTGVYLDGTYFGVIEEYPWEAVEQKGPMALRKAVAYIYDTGFQVGGAVLESHFMFPYRGIIEGDLSINDLDIGIWFKKIRHDKYRKIIRYPKTPREKEEYRQGKEQDIVTAVLDNKYSIDQFADMQLNLSDAGTDVYLPPIHEDDDFLNTMMKMAIRLKCASFAPYGKRLEALAVDRSKGVEGANIRNNTKRALWLNFAMSPSKFGQYGDVWQVEPAIILKDMPGAMHPMHIPEGKMLVMYPNGIEFPINSEDLIDVSDLVAEAMVATVKAEESKKKRKRLVGKDPNNKREPLICGDDDEEEEGE